VTADRDWNHDWELEQREVDELLLSLEEFNNCDHDWVEATEEDRSIGLSETCTKCGGGRTILTADEYAITKETLENGRRTLGAGVAGTDQGTEEGHERPDSD
jgi:hypothetical protein